MESLVGKNPTKVVHPASRRLNSKVPRCGKAYIKSLESNIVEHQLLEQLNAVHRCNLATNKKTAKINIINQEGQDYMRHMEKVCRKIKCCHIPYLPKASIWIRRAQVYNPIIRWHKGKIHNKGNLKRAARRCNIQNPLGMSMAKELLRVKECKRECKFYQENGRRFRTKHLTKQMGLAQERNDKEAFKKIGDIINKEKQRLFWRGLNFVTGKKRTRSAMSVQVEEQRGIFSESSTKETVEDAIFQEVHDKQYTLAKKAPICSRKLFNNFGHVANTLASKAVLDGTYQPQPNSDTAMAELFNKIAAIRQIVPKDSASPVIMPEQWKWYWAIVNKETSSS
jgi:hypothetical protein